MSVEAITWALRQPIKQSTAKFVLVVLANCASGDTLLAYPSAAYLCAATSQDRKTVLANLARLREWGLIEDTGKRAGTTKQIPVWKVLCSPDLFAQPEPEPSQKRNRSENGTVPEIPGKGPVFPREGSQKRDTETSLTIKKQNKAPPSAALADPPSWVDPEAWAGFVEMRKKIRHPLTARAAELVVKELDKLRATGADPTTILDQSTRNSWRDVFPIRAPAGQQSNYGRPEPTPMHQPPAAEVMAGQRARKPADPAKAAAALADLARHLNR